jgi:hypothetical protein
MFLRSESGRGNASEFHFMRLRSPRLPRSTVAIVLSLCALAMVLNYSLAVAVAPLILVFLGSWPFVGERASLAAALCCTSYSAISDALYAVPWAPTPEEDFDELLALRAVIGTNATFLELGSGDGRNLLRAVRGHGYAHAIGVEWSPLLVVLSRLRGSLAGESASITVHRADVLSVPLPADDGRATLTIFLYLSDDLLMKLSSRLACACQGRGQRVSILSRDFELPHWKPLRRLVRDRTILLAYDGDGAPPCTRDASSSANLSVGVLLG